MTRNDYIVKHSSLFWYTPKEKLSEISDSFLVETILNYGSLEDVKELFQVMGIKNVAKVFFNSIGLSERRKGNYHELVLHYFTLLFRRYARWDIIGQAKRVASIHQPL